MKNGWGTYLDECKEKWYWENDNGDVLIRETIENDVIFSKENKFGEKLSFNNGVKDYPAWDEREGREIVKTFLGKKND